MTRGSVTKLVTTFGSNWGRIRGDSASKDIFFNTASLEEPAEFSSLKVGLAVDFDELPDFINGSHAENVVLTSSESSDGASES